MRSTPIFRTLPRSRVGIAISIAAMALLSDAPLAFASQETATWSGGVGSWASATKWSGNSVPSNGKPSDTTYAVVIPGKPDNASVVKLTVPTTIDQLTIGLGSSLDILSGGNLTLAPNQPEAVLVNQGTLALGLAGSQPRLRFTTDRVTLTGGGTVSLMASALKSTNSAFTLVNEDNHILGNGSIAAMNIINRGTISASGGDRLSLYAAYPAANSPLYTVVNSGTLRAGVGNTLVLNKATYNNFEGGTPGRIVADGGNVELQDVTVNGGEVAVLGAGELFLRGRLNARVTNSSTGTILANGQLGGTFINPAGGFVAVAGRFTLTLDSKSSYYNAGTFVSSTPITGGPLYGGSLRLAGGPVIFRGGGMLRLDGTYSRIEPDPASPGSLVLLDQTLSGYGPVTTPVVNMGTILADSSGKTLQFGVITNYGLLKATGGGAITASSVTSYGDWIADGGTIEVSNATVSGTVAATNSGVLVSKGRIASTGDIHLTRGGMLRIASGSVRAVDFTADRSSRLDLVGNMLELSGNFACAMTDERQWRMEPSSGYLSRLAMTGGVGARVGDWDEWASLEIGGRDLGSLTAPGGPPIISIGANFSLPELIIGAGAHINLVDLIDNGNRGGNTEALYVGRLRFADDSALLNLNGLPLYYDQLIGSPAQIINQPVVLNSPIPEPGALMVLSLSLTTLLTRRRAKFQGDFAITRL